MNWIKKNKILSIVVGTSVTLFVVFMWQRGIPEVFSYAVSQAAKTQHAELKKEIDKDISELKNKFQEKDTIVVNNAAGLSKLSAAVVELTLEVKSLKEASDRQTRENEKLSQQVHELLIILLDKKVK